jgi:hypothetical protein
MTKIQLVVVCFLILGRSEFCPAQQLLGKDEIYNDWIKSHPASDNCDTSIDHLSYDANVDVQIQAEIRSLRTKGVDTLLVLVNSHPGLIITDTCRSSSYPSEVYFFWRGSGKETLKRIPNKCGLDDIESSCAPVFDFFSRHQHQLEREYIMPVILGAKKDGNQVMYNRIISNDVDEYILYYSVHGHCKRFAFSQADIKNKTSLFYSDNIESHVYKWFVALQKERKKVERK